MPCAGTFSCSSQHPRQLGLQASHQGIARVHRVRGSGASEVLNDSTGAHIDDIQIVVVDVLADRGVNAALRRREGRQSGGNGGVQGGCHLWVLHRVVMRWGRVSGKRYTYVNRKTDILRRIYFYRTADCDRD